MANNKFIYDYTNLLSERIGKENGINLEDLNKIQDKIDDAFDTVFSNPTLEHKCVCENLDTVDLSKIKSLAKDIRGNFENFIVLGIGGSSLGSDALFTALSKSGYNLLPADKRNGPRFFVVDSIAPDIFIDLINNLDLTKTMFCVVSKSGKTTETMTQFFYTQKRCEELLGESWKEHFVVLTDETDNFLNNFALEHNLKVMYIPTLLGGRYSVLSAVGLLPAAVMGYDIDAIIAGAKSMLAQSQNRNVLENAPLLSAVLNYLNYQNGKKISILIPYTDKLNMFDDWYCQLWGESIGRDLDKDGNKLCGDARVGQTPIQVTGPSVQHSQFQLYLEGLDDKVITFIGVNNYATDDNLPKNLDKLFGEHVTDGRTFGDLLGIERMASTEALVQYSKPSETILIDHIDEEGMGKLFMFFMLKMMFSGALLGINPFGQPAVESIKKGVANMLKGQEVFQSRNKIEL